MSSVAASTNTRAVPGRPARIVGWVCTAAVLVFLILDVGGKLAAPPEVVLATQRLGFTAGQVPVMGVLLAIGVVLQCIPRTTFLGAVWTTAYLGGAVCANFRMELPLFGYIFFPAYLALLMWLGLFLRSPRLRQLVLRGL